jgi:3-hydroxyisobutyrate dehydrogenase-like beta-hydroxyacid dehydrogenase
MCGHLIDAGHEVFVPTNHRVPAAIADRVAGKLRTAEEVTRNADVALARIAKGFQFVTVSSDARLLASGSQQILNEMRAQLKPAASGSGSY